MPDGDLGFRAEIIKSVELVVDKRFQRTDIERADRGRRVFKELRKYREKGSLGLSGCG